jgi:hypothetical protein
VTVGIATPHLRELAILTMSSIHSFDLPTKTPTGSAMQRCPAAPNAAPVIAFTTDWRVASGRMMPWFLAAMLLCTRLPVAPARRYMCSPAGGRHVRLVAGVTGGMRGGEGCVKCGVRVGS